MAHYNLYETLRVDRSADSNSLAREIDARIERQDFSNPGGLDELQIARQILGDSVKKAEYDSRIADESGDEVNIAALRQIAAGETTSGPRGGAPAAAEDAPETRVEAPESAAESQTEQPVGIPAGNPAEQQNYQQPQYSGPQQFQGAPQGQQYAYDPNQQYQYDSNQQGYQQPQYSGPQQFQGAPQGQQYAYDPNQQYQYDPNQQGYQQQPLWPGAKEKFAAATAGLKKNTGEKTAKLRGEFKKSSKSAILATAAFVLVACLLVWGLVAGISHFTGGERKAQNVAKELLKTDNRGEIKDWVREYAFEASEEDILDMVDRRDISRPQDLFDTGAPGVQRVDNISGWMGALLAGESRSSQDDEERQMIEAIEEGEMYFVAIASNDGNGDPVGGLAVTVVDGDVKVFNVGNAKDMN